MALALVATVALSGCAKQSETPVTTQPVAAVKINYKPLTAMKPVTPIKVTETAVANCVAETRKMESNKHLPKKLSGFRKLAAGTEATLGKCAGSVSVKIERLVDDKTKAVTHESLWGEVRTALNEQATAAAQAKANAATKVTYDAGYKAALDKKTDVPAAIKADPSSKIAFDAGYKAATKDIDATAEKQAAADQAATEAASQQQAGSFPWGWTIGGIFVLAIVGFLYVRFVRGK